MSKQALYLALAALVLGAAHVQAQEFQWIRAAYWDQRYAGAWGGGGIAMRDALAGAGYEVLDADALKVWMDARIADREYSVVVFCLDVVPDTVGETMSETCTLRRYLNAGGKIVWYSDWPFYYQGDAGGNRTTWGSAGATSVLGFNASTGPNDSYTTVTITALGAAWGLTETWESRRPTSPTVTDNLSVLALDGNGNAAAWAKHYVANDTFRGFVRIYDRAGAPNPEDVMRVAEYVSLKASNPRPPDGATGVIHPLVEWDSGSFALWHDVYFGTDPEPPLITRQTWNLYYHQPGLEPGVTYYWRIDEVSADAVTIYTGDVWSFTATPLTAWGPHPADGAEKVMTAPLLTWQAGLSAKEHRLYFGEDRNAVAQGAPAADMGIMDALAYQVPATLDVGTTYYWRVDETDASDTLHEGNVWSFTTIDGGPGGAMREWWLNVSGGDIPTLTGDPRFPDDPDGRELLDAMDGPVDWAENYGSRIYGWLFPPETGDYTFWVSGDDNCELWLSTDEDPANAEMIASVGTWTAHLEWDKETTQMSQPQSLVAGQRYYIEALMNEGTGGDSLAVAWQGPGINMEVIGSAYVGPTPFFPTRAYAPFPADGAADTAQDLVLSWNAGHAALQHDVFLGNDEETVRDANTSAGDVYKGRQNTTTFATGPLEWGRTYYWRIDEINTGDPDSPWKGKVWSFATADYIPIDDFETYTNQVGNRVFQTWIDGLGYTEPAPGHPGNGTGALVGHDIWTATSPYYEGQIVEVVDVHGGSQAMPLYYDNSAAPFVSEAERTWTVTQDWTVGGVTDLSIWFHGSPAGFIDNGGGSFMMSASGVDIWGTADQFRFAYKSLNGDGSITARVESIGNTNTWAKGGVMIRESLDPGAKHAMVVVTPGQGIQFTWRAFTNADMTEHSTQANLTAPYWVKLTRTGNTLTAERSEDGVAWVPVTDAANSSHEVPMIGNVYIGLALTSHNVDAVTVADYSGVVTTGSVTGQWQIAEVGMDHPENDRADVYVRLEDNLGRRAVAAYPDGALVADWTEWKIPLADFNGISLNAVKKMILGVGDSVAPAPDGSGMVLCDDIRVVTTPAEEPNDATP